MSADNWDACPFCAKVKKADIAALAAKIEDSYGQVPVDQFDEMRATYARLRDQQPERTFREDYEIGLLEPSSGAADFFIRYTGRCTKCNFGHKFTWNDALTVEPGGAS